jgi:Protein of unknown function (DUF4232)
MHITRHRLGLGVLAAAVVATAAGVVPAVAQASSQGHQAAAVAQCKARNIYVWFALAPNGAAGTVYYPIEFTNVGASTCSLFGYPGVEATNSARKLVGPAAGRFSATRHTVTLKHNQTAHALVGIVQRGIIGGCKAAQADGFQVYPPNQKTKQFISDFSFSVCKNKVYMHVYPVQSGVGVP